METPAEKLAEALKVLQTIQDKGIFAIKSDDLSRTNKDRLITDADKALAILKAFHDIAHNSEKNEGLTIIKDWDINTLTIETKEGHSHFGQMNSEDEKGFSILLNEIYRHYVR